MTITAAAGAITSADVACAATNLGTLASGLDQRAGEVDPMVAAVSGHVDTVAQHASSPRSGLLVGRVRSYVSERAKPYAGALAAAAETARGWKRDAITARDALDELEDLIRSREARRGAPAEADRDELDLRAWRDSVDTWSANWRRTCLTRGEELATATRRIKFCNGELNLSGEFVNVDVTGSVYTTRLQDLAVDIGVAGYQPGDEVEPMQAGFIMWLLDPYHDAVGHAIAAESGAQFERGNKLSDGGLPDFGMHGPGVFWIGELKYATPWSIDQGTGKLLEYTAQNKNGMPVEAHDFIVGTRFMTVGPVMIQYGNAPGVTGLLTYQVVAGWSIPDLINNRQRARARDYATVPAAAAAEIGVDTDVVEPIGEFVPNPAMTDEATTTSSAGGDGGTSGIIVPRLPDVDPTPYVVTVAGGALVIGGVIIWGLLD